MTIELQLPQARSAQFEGISFRADGWAIRQNEALTARIRQLQAKAEALAAMPGAAPIPEDVVVSLIYRHGKVSAAYWSAMSRVMSPMITGPARFPVERNRKRSATADKRLGEIEPDLQRALKALERLAFPHGMPGDAIRGDDPAAEQVEKLVAGS